MEAHPRSRPCIGEGIGSLKEGFWGQAEHMGAIASGRELAPALDPQMKRWPVDQG
jgi:hypothetical protein